MGEPNQGKTSQANLSKQTDGKPRSLMLTFSSKNPKHTELPNAKPKLDLSLGLSLGGVHLEHFKEKPVIRSSSNAGMITEKVNTGEPNSAMQGIFFSFQRSCSLPVENKQREIMIKDLPAKKRIEAQRSLVEKQRKGGMAAIEKENPSAEKAVPPSPTYDVAAWAVASAARSPALCRAIGKIKAEGQIYGKRKLKAKVDTSSLSLPNPMETKPVFIPEATEKGKSVKLSKRKLKKPSKKVKVSKGCFQDNGMDVMKQMPSVTTTGDGPNGKRIEGFLYRYTKSQVSIVCVCHGSSLSPAEFVKHAGGKDVKHPLKHITVFPSF
ncbi:ninja-family protein AFP3-like isoform X2 [Juglans microcarpa x Juglans regia]|uniref:ninja-family protein AFP3-like isoform X2 n=1 Tax=Juglans microcarpa x Juglans regia TaxID=2249226 RepID=UPI001B7DAE43|nr:ninja-family protein AFP3-like isoform X2 [Juglans microcarpa x Juglans regia]